MWKVGDTCWILNRRRVLRKAVVVELYPSYMPDYDSMPYRVRTVGGVYCKPWLYSRTPESLIEQIRRWAVGDLQRAQSSLKRAQQKMETLDADIQAMLDAALEGESC